MLSPIIRRVGGVYVVALAIAVLCCLALPGCYHFRVKEQSTSGNGIEHSEMRSAFLWGLIEEPIELHPSHENPRYQTPGRGLHLVEVNTNFGYALVTVLTLGIWCPAEVTWVSQPGSDFGDSGRGGGSDGR